MIDIGKATFPAWLTLHLGLDEILIAAVGLAAVAGHNWPIFHQLKGGRGLSPMLGTWLILYPWGVVWMLGWLTLGYLLGDSAPWAIVSLLTLPILNLLTEGPGIVFGVAFLMLLLTFGKRLEANRRPLPPPGTDRTAVIWRRLIFDRDIAHHQRWIRREPSEKKPEA